MKKIKEFDFETGNARFNLTIYEQANGRGFVGEYFGTSPKFAQVTGPGAAISMMKEIGSGKITHKTFDDLLVNCRAAIEAIDGPIEKTFERNI